MGSFVLTATISYYGCHNLLQFRTLYKMRWAFSIYTKVPFSGVDMLMKAVGKDCTSLFSILPLDFCMGVH